MRRRRRHGRRKEPEVVVSLGDKREAFPWLKVDRPAFIDRGGGLPADGLMDIPRECWEHPSAHPTPEPTPEPTPRTRGSSLTEVTEVTEVTPEAARTSLTEVTEVTVVTHATEEEAPPATPEGKATGVEEKEEKGGEGEEEEGEEEERKKGPPPDPYEGLDPLAMEMLEGSWWEPPTRVSIATNRRRSITQNASSVEYPSKAPLPRPQPVGPMGNSLLGEDAAVVPASERPNVVVLAPCKDRESTLNPGFRYPTSSNLSNAAMVVVRDLAPGEGFRLFGEPTSQAPIVVHCHCQQTPCQYVLPPDWMAACVDIAEPSVAGSLWSMPLGGSTMRSSALFGADAEWERREAFLASRSFSGLEPEPGDLHTFLPDLPPKLASVQEGTLDGGLSTTFGSSFLSLPGAPDAGTGSLEFTSLLSVYTSQTDMLSTMTRRGPAASPIAATTTAASFVSPVRASRVGFGESRRAAFGGKLKVKTRTQRVWAAHDPHPRRASNDTDPLFPGRTFAGVSEAATADVVVDTRPRRKKKSRARPTTGVKFEWTATAGGSCKGKSRAWASYAAELPDGRQLWRFETSGRRRVATADVQAWDVLLRVCAALDGTEAPGEVFQTLVRLSFPSSTDALFAHYLYPLVDWGAVAAAVNDAAAGRVAATLILPPLPHTPIHGDRLDNDDAGFWEEETSA